MKLLILFPHQLWQTKMSIVRRSVIRELLKRPNTHLSGQGWPDYRNNESLQANVDRLGGDAVFAYKPLGGKEFPALAGCNELRQPLVLSYNEMWDVEWTTQEILDSGCKLAICHHENDIPKYEHIEDCRFTHIPHCADPELFATHALPWDQRDIPFLLTGVLSPQIYPLRERFANLIRTGKIPGVIHPHPGYRLENVEACDRQSVEYAKMLGRAKVSLCCTSIHKYALAKHFESALAGCCVVSDKPQQNCRELIFPVDSSASDDALVNSLRVALAASEDMGSVAQSVAMNQYTTAHYAERFVDAVRAALR